MKNFAVQVFVALGVIFLILMLIGIYFFMADPYGLRPMLFGGSAPMQSSSDPDSSAQSEDDSAASTEEAATSGGFELSSAQVDALVSLGIDPAAVPSSISAEQEACFVGVLGEARVAEIKAGAVPSAFEMMKAQSCI